MSDFEKELIENGYKEFDIPIIKKYASKFYKKKVRDKEGITKYFIDCYCYHWDKGNTMTYEFELYVKTGLCCIKTNLYGFDIDNLDLVKIENHIEEIYEGIVDKLKEEDDVE